MADAGKGALSGTGARRGTKRQRKEEQPKRDDHAVAGAVQKYARGKGNRVKV